MTHTRNAKITAPLAIAPARKPASTGLRHETLATDADALAAVNTDASATAAIWLAAKEIETAAGRTVRTAKGDRGAAAQVLAGLLANGDTVTVHGNARYTFVVTDVAASVNGAKVLAALAAVHPELADEIAEIAARPANLNRAYTKIDLKRERK